ncbi:MAG: hypothetical protein ACFCUN_02650 [Hyphomicrobiaceae bacterium]
MLKTLTIATLALATLAGGNFTSTANAASALASVGASAQIEQSGQATNLIEVSRRGGHRGHFRGGHRGGHHFKRHFGFYKHYGPRYYGHAYKVYDSCGYARRKWTQTGSQSWKRRYYVCKGWW